MLPVYFFFSPWGSDYFVLRRTGRTVLCTSVAVSMISLKMLRTAYNTQRPFSRTISCLVLPTAIFSKLRCFLPTLTLIITPPILFWFAVIRQVFEVTI